jgi:hypothetical protein
MREGVNPPGVSKFLKRVTRPFRACHLMPLSDVLSYRRSRILPCFGVTLSCWVCAVLVLITFNLLRFGSEPLQFWVILTQLVLMNLTHTWYLMKYAWDFEGLSGVLKELEKVDEMLRRIGRRVTYQRWMVWRAFAWSLVTCSLNGVGYFFAMSYYNAWLIIPMIMCFGLPIPLMTVYGIPVDALLHVSLVQFESLSKELERVSVNRQVLLSRLHRIICYACQKINTFIQTIVLLKSTAIFFLAFSQAFNIIKTSLQLHRSSGPHYLVLTLAHSGYLLGWVSEGWCNVSLITRVSQKVICILNI